MRLEMITLKLNPAYVHFRAIPSSAPVASKVPSGCTPTFQQKPERHELKVTYVPSDHRDIRLLAAGGMLAEDTFVDFFVIAAEGHSDQR